ncbi:hypothetical protein ACFW9X_00255 [Streptomyces sp. NPDC059466]|uniref:hypothetical protein n=1 Tax=Streptomyces sp. NPDC059466 TaxID=3346843 RepID=UPI0036881926
MRRFELRADERGLVELKVTRWKRYGHDRLYANLRDGAVVGWTYAKTGTMRQPMAAH